MAHNPASGILPAVGVPPSMYEQAEKALQLRVLGGKKRTVRRTVKRVEIDPKGDEIEVTETIIDEAIPPDMQALRMYLETRNPKRYLRKEDDAEDVGSGLKERLRKRFERIRAEEEAAPAPGGDSPTRQTSVLSRRLAKFKAGKS